MSFLLDRYGPVLSVEELGEVLKKKPTTVKAALSLRRQDWAKALHAHQVKIGGNTYYPAEIVADLVAGADPADLAAKKSTQPEEHDDA